MRYNSESLEIKVAISGNSLLSKDIKISLGLLITVRKLHALFRRIITSANNRILELSLEPKIRSKSYCLVILLNEKN